MRTVALVTNPAAGRRARTAGAVTAQLLRTPDVRVRDVTGPTAEQSLAGAQVAVRDGVDALVVVGGDGMVNLGVNACAGSDVPLGIVAAGSGNDLARALRLPQHDVPAAVALAVGSWERPRALDAVRAAADSGPAARWFVGVLAAGFDAVVNERVNGWPGPRGRARYVAGVARELPRFRPIRYRLTLDGVCEDTHAMLMAVANGPAYGGGMRVAPDASLADGLLDVVVLAPLPTAEFVRVFPSVFTGRHVNHPAVSVRRARTVRVESMDTPIVGYADGERIGTLPLTCEVVPGALRVLA